MKSCRGSWIVVVLMSTNLIALVVLVVQSARASITDSRLQGNIATSSIHSNGNISALLMNDSSFRQHTNDVGTKFQNQGSRVNTSAYPNKDVSGRAHNSNVILPQTNVFTTVVTKQQRAVAKLRHQFDILFKKSISEAEQSGKYLIYKCDEACNTRNQFHEGLISSFVIAMLSKRQLKVIQTNKCSALGMYDTPELLQWKNLSSVELYDNPARVLVPSVKPSYHTTAVFRLAQEIPKIDFESTYTENLLYHTENYNWLLDLRRNIWTYRKFPWMPSLSISDLIRLVYTGMFHVPDPLQSEIRNIISEKVGNGKLFCYFGELPASANFTKLKNLLETYSDEYTYYSNSEQGQNMFETLKYDDKVLNMDRLRNVHSEECSRDFIVDLEVATYCDVLITTEELNGVLGAVLRPTSKDLYCVSRFGEPYSCTRNLVTGSFRTDLPVKINIYLFQKMKL